MIFDLLIIYFILLKLIFFVCVQVRLATALQHRRNEQRFWRPLPRHPQIHGGAVHLPAPPPAHHTPPRCPAAALDAGPLCHTPARAQKKAAHHNNNNNSEYNSCSRHNNRSSNGLFNSRELHHSI
jgi:hypothetical protein